jgi:hypothetical protein
MVIGDYGFAILGNVLSTIYSDFPSYRFGSVCIYVKVERYNNDRVGTYIKCVSADYCASYDEILDYSDRLQSAVAICQLIDDMNLTLVRNPDFSVYEIESAFDRDEDHFRQLVESGDLQAIKQFIEELCEV